MDLSQTIHRTLTHSCSHQTRTPSTPQEAAQDAARSLWARPAGRQAAISSDSPGSTGSTTMALGHPPAAQPSSVTHSFLGFVLASH